MARRSFTVIDVTEILVHWYAGRPKTEVADSLGVDRKTVRKYLAPAEAAGFVPGGPPVSAAQWTERVREWFGGAGRHRAAAGVLAGDRGAPRVHQRGVEGRGDRGDGPSAAARRARAGGVGGQPAPVGAGEPARGGPPRPGAGAAPRRRRTWRGGPSRLRQVGDVARPGQRSAAGGVGVRAGAGLLAAHVRAPGAHDGPAVLDPGDGGRVRVLRGLCGCRFHDRSPARAMLAVFVSEELPCGGRRACSVSKGRTTRSGSGSATRWSTTTWGSSLLGVARTRCSPRPTTSRCSSRWWARSRAGCPPPTCSLSWARSGPHGEALGWCDSRTARPGCRRARSSGGWPVCRGCSRTCSRARTSSCAATRYRGAWRRGGPRRPGWVAGWRCCAPRGRCRGCWRRARSTPCWRC